MGSSSKGAVEGEEEDVEEGAEDGKAGEEEGAVKGEEEGAGEVEEEGEEGSNEERGISELLHIDSCIFKLKYERKMSSKGIHLKSTARYPVIK